MQKTRMLESTDRPTFAPAAWTALGLTVVTVVLLAALHFVSPEFDPSWRMVSEYALGRYPWLLSLMFLSWGVSTWALAVAIRPNLAGRAGRAGLVFLVLAGLGEVMAAVFDINQDIGHGIAGLLGVGGLPIAAVLVTRALPRDGSWASARRPLMGLAVLTWLAVVSLIATLILMTIQVVQAYGGRLPDVAPAALPPGVFRLAGWTDRLIVAANCLWVFAVAWRATLVSRSRTRRPAPVAATVRVDAGRGRARELRPLEPLFTHTLAFGRPSKENQAMTATKIDRVDDYLALLPEERRTALERLRAEVHAAAPAATEAISYGMPAFRLGERYFLGFGATKTHCSFYVGRAPLQACAPQLAGYRVWKGTINFTPGSPDPGPPRGGAHTLPSRGVRAGVTTKLACRRAASCRNRSIWNRPGKYAVERRGVVQLRCLETSAPAPSGRVRNRQLASTSRVNGAQDDADERRPL